MALPLRIHQLLNRFLLLQMKISCYRGLYDMNITSEALHKVEAPHHSDMHESQQCHKAGNLGSLKCSMQSFLEEQRFAISIMYCTSIPILRKVQNCAVVPFANY